MPNPSPRRTGGAVGVNDVDQLRDPAVAVGDESGLEHRLDDRVVFRADGRAALRSVEGPALERRDHRVDVVAALADDAGHQPPHAAQLADLLDERPSRRPKLLRGRESTWCRVWDRLGQAHTYHQRPLAQQIP